MNVFHGHRFVFWEKETHFLGIRIILEQTHTFLGYVQVWLMQPIPAVSVARMTGSLSVYRGDVFLPLHPFMLASKPLLRMGDEPYAAAKGGVHCSTPGALVAYPEHWASEMMLHVSLCRGHLYVYNGLWDVWTANWSLHSSVGYPPGSGVWQCCCNITSSLGWQVLLCPQLSGQMEICSEHLI